MKVYGGLYPVLYLFPSDIDIPVYSYSGRHTVFSVKPYSVELVRLLQPFRKSICQLT